MNLLQHSGAAQHHRAFVVTIVWTLALLLLGSVVHATESSLACPDWPTCFGSYLPEMEGGVFWEHLHRLVAGGLILMFGLATWLAFRDRAPAWIRWTAVAGVGMLLVQAVLGGLTVLMQLPDAISTSHLSLALIFLATATTLAVATSPRRRTKRPLPRRVRKMLRYWGTGAAVLVFLQSVIGGLVRHMDAGMACPDVPTCGGRWIPDLTNQMVAVQFTHRVVGVVATLVILALAVRLLRAPVDRRLRRFGTLVAGLVLLQMTLGIVSVLSILAVAPVSLHTLGAALLLATLVALATWGWIDWGTDAPNARMDLEFLPANHAANR